MKKDIGCWSSTDIIFKTNEKGYYKFVNNAFTKNIKCKNEDFIHELYGFNSEIIKKKSEILFKSDRKKT